MNNHNNYRALFGKLRLLLPMLIAQFFLSQTSLAYVTFETGQVRPMAMTADGNTLFAVNTPGGYLEIYDVESDGLSHRQSVPVGLEPVAVAVHGSDVWVVNHLSDSVSIVDTSTTPARVVRTLLVGDEPRDIVFAGPGGNRAFITAAHRGQNSPYTSATNPGEMTTPGTGRADVWVFQAGALGGSLGGSPITIVTLFGDTPRALATSPDGSTVYAAVFQSGNQTTTVSEGAVCNGGASSSSCSVSGATAPGGLPAPNQSDGGQPAPETGLIVKFDGTNWLDELGRQWDGVVRFNLPDLDVFAIDANATTPVETDSWPGVGTILFNMATHPVSGDVYVSNTEAFNHVRFEGSRGGGDTTSTVQGHLHETRVTIIDPGLGSVTPRHINKHIDYTVRPAPAGVKQNSLGLPRQLAFSADGSAVYLAAKGSDKVGFFTTANLDDNSFSPSSADHAIVSGGGPSGLLVDDARGRLYVTTRYDNGISIVDTATKSETVHYVMPNPEPATVVDGRRFLYDANLTSSNGEVACGSCHVDGDFDSLAWDLGDPTGDIINNPGPFKVNIGPQDYHPMKGPMTSQTLRGMDGHGPMHWRGDRTGGNDEANVPPDGGIFNEELAFKKFIVAFEGLNGAAAAISDPQMDAFTNFILEVMMPPNPIRNLDDSLTASQDAGKTFYFGPISDTFFNCNGCHVLDPPNKLFGTDGFSTFENEPQMFKVAQLRNLYTKVGMFGMPNVPFFNGGNNGHQGDQIRGFGFLHDGSTDTMERFFNASVFNFPGGNTQRQQVEQFMLAFDNNIKPVVGQQITQTPTNKATTDPRVDLLLARAAAGDNDVVASGIISGEMRRATRLANGTFQLDRAADAPLTATALQNLVVSQSTELTFTAVPLNSGIVYGIDRDDDGILNADDVCPNIADPLQDDGDSDLVGNLCDVCTAAADADQRDSNGDGYGNRCDADVNNDGATNSLDLGIYAAVFFTDDADADINGDGTVNSLDLGLLVPMFFNPPGPSGVAP